MDKRKQNHIDPWDEGVYGTGNTHPPKSYGGIIALLLIVVILLCGIVTMLSIMNIRLFRELSMEKKEESAALSFSSGIQPVLEDVEPTCSRYGIQQIIGEEPGIVLNKAPNETELPVEEEPSLQDVYNKTLTSVVNVACRTYDGTASGSGIVLNDQGYIITNYRLVENAETITVELSDQRCFTASVAGADLVSDIAVLRIQAENLIPAEFGDSSQLRIGDDVITMAPELDSADADSVISGICNGVILGGRTMDLFQTDLEPDQEGLLLNRYGQIIGIHTGEISRIMDAGENQSFSIPSQTVKQIVDELISQGYVSGRPSLGVEGKFLNLFDQHYYHIPAGLYITAVTPGSSAEEKGLNIGDVLISVNDMPISDSAALNRLLCSIQVGDTVQVVVYRDERYYTLELTIAEHRG